MAGGWCLDPAARLGGGLVVAWWLEFDQIQAGNKTNRAVKEAIIQTAINSVMRILPHLDLSVIPP